MKPQAAGQTGNRKYYEVTGIENPKGTNTQDKHLVEFEPVVFEFNRKQDSD